MNADNGRDRKLTMVQNYKRLGLSSKLNAPTGGIEKKANRDGNAQTIKKDSLQIAGFTATKLMPEEVQVERDPETGRIIRVIQPDSSRENDNPLNDPLNDIMDYETEAPATTSGTNVVAQLEAQAAAEEEELATKRRPRQQSQREDEWISNLIAKHGDNVKAMVRDRKLNPMQQTEGDIGRRMKKWKAAHGEVTS
jgi:nucleolar protein 16